MPSASPLEDAAALGAVFAEQLGLELSADQDRCVGSRIASRASPGDLTGVGDRLENLSPGLVAAVAEALSTCIEPARLLEPLADAYFGIIPELTRGQRVCLTRALVDRYGVGYFLGVPATQPGDAELERVAEACGLDPSLVQSG